MTVTKMNGVISRYRAYLPLGQGVEAVSLCEGMTPLIPLRNLVDTLPKRIEWYVKFEGLNPTGSFKDRGMTVAISEAKASGRKAVICAAAAGGDATALTESNPQGATP